MTGYNKQSGFTLFETLIAWMILVTVWFGLLKAQTYLFRHCYGVYRRQVLLFRAQSLLERLRASHSDAVRAYEFQLWQQLNQKTIADIEASYQCGVYNCHVVVQPSANQSAPIKL